MVELLATYGPSGALVAAVYVLARVIERLVDSRRPRRPAVEDGAMITMKDLREDIHHRADQTQGLITTLTVKVALVERDVAWIQRTMKANGHGEKE